MKLIKRKLAKRLMQAGEYKEVGDTVYLRPDQIARLEPDGYFEPASTKNGKRKQGAGK